MPLIYLTFLKDFNMIPTYSWGFAVLACLFRNLDVACMKGIEHVEECLLLFTGINEII